MRPLKHIEVDVRRSGATGWPRGTPCGLLQYLLGRACSCTADVISIEGQIELVDGQRTLRIPRSAGGEDLAALARGIGHFDGEVLSVVIQPWLAEKLRIAAGSLVVVDNEHGKFTITRSAKNDL